MSSKTILFAMLDESGHLNPTFKLAKTLKARGHDVRYLAVADLAPMLEAQGFSVEVLLPELFPKGGRAAEQRLGMLAQRRAITRRYRALLDHLRTAAPFDLTQVPPDLMLVDVTQPHFALWARSRGVPFLHINTSLPQTKDAGVPPLRSGEPYGEAGLGRLRAELSWARFLAKRRVSAEIARAAGMCPPYEMARREAPTFSLPRRALDWRTIYMPQLRGVPELVLCPEAFDFPRAARPDRHYVESIDLGRRETQLDPALLPSDKPLVYCAFGGQRYRVDDKRQFFVKLLSVMRERPSWHLLLALSRQLHESELGIVPPNVTIVESAPQLSILRRAQVMITHAGLGSVKECILHGVPMLTVPLDIDQPGNAARVVHHGLGLRADVLATPERVLLEQLEQLMFEQPFRERIRAMQARFRLVEQAQHGADVVEARLPGARVAAG
ncbi:MAG: glycosyltransferase [Polyangiales bacterium]